MLILFVRVIVLYLLVFFVLRLTGKRQLSELQPFDLVVTLLIADLASEPASNTGVPLIYGIVPILALFLLQQFISFLSLKSEGVRKLVCGQSVVLVSRGIVQEIALRGSRYTLFDLMEQLRSKDVFELADVEYAILETNGELSVLLKGPQQTPTYQALHIPSPEARPPFMLVQDGEIHHEALSQAGYDETWLHKQLKKGGAACIDDVFFAFLGSDGILHIQRKHETGGEAVYIHTERKGTEKEK